MEFKDSTGCPTLEEVSVVVGLLAKLSSSNPNDDELNLETSDLNLLERALCSKIVSELTTYNPSDESSYWKHLCKLFYLISYLDNAFAENHELECLSVQQIKSLTNSVGVVVEVGILKNLQLLQKKSPKGTASDESALVYYKQLLGTLYGFNICFKSSFLRSLLITNFLKPVLLSFYQIIYCPLKKPNLENPEMEGFVMTSEIYNNLIKDRDNFKHIFRSFVSSIHPMLYIRETMLLLDKSSPNWLKKSLSNTLSVIIRSPKGVQNVVKAMFDSVGLDELDDSTKSWNIILAIAKLIMGTCMCPDFKENTCKQLYELLKLRTQSGETFKPFERLFALCTKLLYQQNRSLCDEVFIRNTLEPLMSFTNNSHQTFEGQSKVIDSSVEQSIRICYYLTTENNLNIPFVPVNVIFPVFNIMFNLFLVYSSKTNIYNDIKCIFLNSLNHIELNEAFALFDTFLFGYSHKQILEVQKDIEFCSDNNQIVVKRQTYSVRVSILNRAEAISDLLNNNIKIKTMFFSYLLNCLSEHDKYFSGNSSSSLLDLENTHILQETSERSIAVYKLLSELTSDQSIQTEISKNPELVIKYITAVIQSCVKTNVHKANESDSNRFQTLFLLVMLLQIFIENATIETRDQYTCFSGILKLVHEECTNSELKELCNRVLIHLEGEQTFLKSSALSELDIALQDICDPLLPVRGHALMTLSKLIEKRNKEIMERKHYILNIFMQNLRNDDSFIYLSAIGGLAAMGDVFPDIVLNTLADEYVDFSKKGSEDGHEVRMKLGEVLIRITKILGEMAPKYKTLLLNTFLEVTKDEDHLMRASSLSNLGEVCKVLGYKLGTIVSEVLVCVHSIITTDKAPEPRRAAVTVLRQLFVGLEKEMIVYLRDDILPIYRTLKQIYYQDKDDIMRLQAQLALEQLNENMKEFVFFNPQLHTEKKIVMLN